MSKTRIFVSSTCYDLAAVREDLRRFLLQLGHEPILSEYASFPVNPNETAIANCKKNAKAHSDVLVLIVGGRRGALDPATGKSITNLEYETARDHGIPCFVFINHAVLTLLPVWKKNPSADFSPAVDYPEVFKFIDRIQTENRWTFVFDKTGEIQECLSNQLSFMFRELLGRYRSGTLDPVASYSSESPEAQRLALEKPAVLDKQWVKRGKEASRLRPQSGASWGSTAAALLLLARCREREVWHSAPKAERLGAKNEWLDI
jgi:hypothetical protein